LAFIEVVDLVREFRSHRRYPGAWGAVRSLFTRTYDVRRAVDGISFSIERGDAVGYVGPNGAGKSTTIKILTGILVPTSGAVRVNGRDPYRHRTENARRMGVVFGQRSQLWWDLPLAESFELHRHIYQIPLDRYRRTLLFCEELLGVREFRGYPVRQLSLGQRMRAELAQALLHEPDVLFLDEPTIGLDVLVKDRIRQFLRTANREFGVTIILTTHDLRDIEEICPRLLMIDRGRLVWDGPVTSLKAQHQRTRTLVVEFAVDPGSCDLPSAELIQDEGRRKSFRFDRDVTSTPALLAELMGRYAVEDAAVAEPNIEDVIRDLYASFGTSRPAATEEIDTWSRVRAVTQ
jgi:ABC-2 type transport system ATP-binding protein